MASKSFKQRKALTAKPALKSKRKPLAKQMTEEKPPSPSNKATVKHSKSSSPGSHHLQEHSKEQKPTEDGSIAALAMQAGRAAAEASPNKRSRADDIMLEEEVSCES